MSHHWKIPTKSEWRKVARGRDREFDIDYEVAVTDGGEVEPLEDQAPPAPPPDDFIPPPAPQGITVVPSQSGGRPTAVVSWQSVEQATHYNVRFKPQGGSDYTTVATANLSQRIEDLEGGETYAFGVESVNARGLTSGFGDDTFATMHVIVPSKYGGIEIVDNLPALPDANYPEGTVVFWTITDKLHRSTGTAWTTAVTSSDISNLTADKITAGTIQAAILMGASFIIRSGTTGARLEIDRDGLRLYNASDVLVGEWETATGDVTTVGTFKTAVSGTRWEMSSASNNLLAAYESGVDNRGSLLIGNKSLLLTAPNNTGDNLAVVIADTDNSDSGNSRVTAISEDAPTWFHNDDQTESTGRHIMSPMKFVRRTASKSITSSTTLVDDGQIALSVLASSTYVVEMMLRYDAATGGDLKWAFTGPSGFSAQGTIARVHTNATVDTDDSTVASDLSAPSGQVLGGLGSGTTAGAIVKGIVRTSATAGTLTLQWAQNTSSGTATRVFADSYLSLVKVA